METIKNKRVLNEQGRFFYKSMLFVAIFTYVSHCFMAMSLGLKDGFFATHVNSVATVCFGIYGIGVIWFTIHVIKKLKIK